MLTNLHIENIAVIEKADIEFRPGFNVLTGETGAGKSIVIDSIDAVLGGRTSREIVRRGAEKAVVSAVFTDVDAAQWCDENDVDYDGELILQRRITADGKSTCRVNGMPVTAQQVRGLASLLLDIHGQDDGRQLLDEAKHLWYLDRFGETEEQLSDFRCSYREYKRILREMESLSMDEVEKARLTENLQYQIQELEKAEIRSGEYAELTERRDLMKNAEKLRSFLEESYEALYTKTDCAVDQVSQAEMLTGRAAALAPELQSVEKSLTDCRYALQDAAERVGDFLQSLDFSPQEFDRIETRLSLLNRLFRKYSADEDELLQRLEKCKEQLDTIEYSADMLIKLEKQLASARNEAMKKALVLSKKRQEAAKTLAERVVSELRDLSMPSVKFVVEFEKPGGEPGFDANGCDSVRFLMSANAGDEPGRISKIASGGELSRIMLAMKSVFADKDNVASLVFDEIDTGVSGIAAQSVSEKISILSGFKQIICITHLPQLAAMADTHFSIEKQEKNGKTYTKVTKLDAAGRERELARLYGGSIVTETTLETAREQLRAAEVFKTANRR